MHFIEYLLKSEAYLITSRVNGHISQNRVVICAQNAIFCTLRALAPSGVKSQSITNILIRGLVQIFGQVHHYLRQRKSPRVLGFACETVSECEFTPRNTAFQNVPLYLASIYIFFVIYRFSRFIWFSF